MLLDKERRFQYIYILLSGLIVNILIILAGLMMKVSNENDTQAKAIEYLRSRKLLKPSNLKWTYNNTWQTIGDATFKHAIYSAYYDSRIDIVEEKFKNTNEWTIGSIRIFAILPERFHEPLKCLLRFSDFSIQEIRPQQYQLIDEYRNFIYGVYTIMCPLYDTHKDNDDERKGPIRLPREVALAYQSNPWSYIHPKFIPISYPHNISRTLYGKSQAILSVCVGPLHNHYSKVLRVVEFIEFYRLLGAKHFYFYDFNASHDVRRVLQYYRDHQHIVDILSWNLPEYNDTELYGFGRLGQINDCIYRARIIDNYRYAAIIDLDEILMPLKHNTLIDYLLQCDNGLIASFMFRNVFFYNQDISDNFSIPHHTRNRFSYTQLKVRRHIDAQPPNKLSKCIVNAESAIIMANYHIQDNIPGYNNHIVHTKFGLLYHYRDKCYNCKAILIVDYTARRYGSLLWDRMDHICLKNFLINRGLCPLN